MVEVQSTITDADGDMLTWSVMSDMEMYATAMVDDMGMVTITGVAAGMATITVTATDSGGMSTMQDIMVKVNAGPMAGEDIADQMITVGDDPLEVATAFTDANGDMLTYMASSSNDMVATAMVDDMGMVMITAVGAGMATITVTATDPHGMSAMQDIMVTVSDMMLGAPSITSVDAGMGMATIMLMPGANATSHYIWAQPTDGSTGMWSGMAAGDATSVEMSGLASGKRYWFIAVAGRGEGDDADWAWSGWTSAIDIQ